MRFQEKEILVVQQVPGTFLCSCVPSTGIMLRKQGEDSFTLLSSQEFLQVASVNIVDPYYGLQYFECRIKCFEYRIQNLYFEA
jgi:hypothetical protein